MHRCLPCGTLGVGHTQSETCNYEKSATKFERLNRKFFEVIAEKPATIFIILREKTTGEMIAFMFCFDMGERLINMFIGMDYSRPKEWMLFFRLWEAVVDLALPRGFFCHCHADVA